MLIASLNYYNLSLFLLTKLKCILINIIVLLTIKELEDKLAHEGVKPSAKQLAESKQEEKPTAPYWFEHGIFD